MTTYVHGVCYLVPVARFEHHQGQVDGRNSDIMAAVTEKFGLELAELEQVETERECPTLECKVCC